MMSAKRNELDLWKHGEDQENRKTNEERRRTVESLREITHGNVTEEPRLGCSSRNQFFSLILSDSELPRGLNEIPLHFSSYL